ncbi:DUF6597 domain-containing transcriptional factor [Sphingobacterium sp.]|uniref:DUF6597 domain-containing transcriptional factor n=1 Tax=Sphingobacterium sp. TaxID=341027 RepID=UPI0031D38C25
MEYKKVKPYKELEPFIHFYWELKGKEYEKGLERVFPDGCAGILLNLGNRCLTDNGGFSVDYGKTYVVGAMNAFKDSLIDNDTHLICVCLKPATFANFYHYASQIELTNNTIEFEKSIAFDVDKVYEDPFKYFDRFYSERIKTKTNHLHTVINDIHLFKGRICVFDLAKRNCITVRQLERNFKKFIGLSPQEYSNIEQNLIYSSWAHIHSIAQGLSIW